MTYSDCGQFDPLCLGCPFSYKTKLTTKDCQRCKSMIEQEGINEHQQNKERLQKGEVGMIDREKLIEGLRRCTEKAVPDCFGCPYSCHCEEGDTWVIKDDALAMLTEQETVKPKKIKGYNPPMYTLYEYECEECKTPMMNKQPFCMGCGKPVKWND